MRRHGQLVERRQIEEIAARARRARLPRQPGLRRSARRHRRRLPRLADPAGHPRRRRLRGATPSSCARCSTASSRRRTGPARSARPRAAASEVRGADRAPHRLPSRRPRLRVGLSRAGRALRCRSLRDLRHLPRRHGAPVRAHAQGLRDPARRRSRSTATSSTPSRSARVRTASAPSWPIASSTRSSSRPSSSAISSPTGATSDRAGADELRSRGAAPRPAPGRRSARSQLPRRARRDDRRQRAASRVDRRRRSGPRRTALRRPRAGRAPELARIEREDTDDARAVAAGDPDAFFESVASDGDRRRICG